MNKGEIENVKMSDEQEICETLGRLPPEYVRKVLIFSRTLERIFIKKCSANK